MKKIVLFPIIFILTMGLAFGPATWGFTAEAAQESVPLGLVGLFLRFLFGFPASVPPGPDSEIPEFEEGMENEDFFKEDLLEERLEDLTGVPEKG